MNYLHTISGVFMIVQIVQLSYADLPEPYNFASNDPKIYYNATKEMVRKFEPLIQSVLADLPATEEYNKYKEELELYLQHLEDRISIKGLCFVKILEIMEDFVDLLTPYKLNDAPAEAKAVLGLFNSHGFERLDKDFQELLKNYNAEEFGKHVDKLSQEDDKEVLEVC